jgi:hypothetical protein
MRLVRDGYFPGMTQQRMPRHDHDVDATVHTGDVQHESQPTGSRAHARPRFSLATVAVAVVVVVAVVLVVLLAF